MSTVLGLVALVVTAFGAAPSGEAPRSTLALTSALDASAPIQATWTDAERGVSLVPPPGWQRSPATSLNPQSDPPDPVFELARFQLRLGDPALYAQPVALTSGLVADAKAVLSIGLAREGSDLAAMDARGRAERGSLAAAGGFVFFDEDASFEGARTYTRYLFSRSTDRVVVARAIALESELPALGPRVTAALASVRADPRGASGPVAVAPPRPAEVLAAPAQVADPTIELRADILARAQLMLGVAYVWGGNSTVRGMDCSAYVSRAWGVDRYTTETIGAVSFPIGKEELRAGDALNLPIWKDPRRLGHVRIFEAWANAEHSLIWVFEETPPRAVHRVIAYDDRYEPIRLAGLSDAGTARLIPGTPARDDQVRPSVPQPRPASRPTARPAARPTARATPRATARPSAVPRPRPAPATEPRERG